MSQQASTFDAAPLERAIESVTPGIVPSLSVAVLSPGAPPWLSATGFADLEQRRRASPATAYAWFSMTKIVTATVAMQLVERGDLDLDDPVSRYVVEMPARRSGEAVTVRELLSHSAGLANPLPVRWVHLADETGPASDALVARLLERQRRLKGSSGEARYSNVGFLVLGEVLAAAGGRPYEELVRTMVLGPLGMRRTDFSYTPAVLQDVATSYHWRRGLKVAGMELLLPRRVRGPRVGQYRQLRRFLVDGAAYGGLIGPAEDAARFLAAHLNDGRVDGTALLTPRSVTAMQIRHARGRALDVGLGWFRRRSDGPTGERYWEHLGGGAGYWSMMRLYPDRRIGMVTMGNATVYDHQALVRAVLAGHELH